MKKFVVNLFSIVFTVSMLVCCASTKGVQKEIIYTEMDSSEFNDSSFNDKVSKGVNGFIVKNAQIYEGSSINSVELNTKEFEERNPDFKRCIEYERKYTFYFRVEERGDFFSGYTYVPILEKIEGLRSLDEIQKEQEEKEAAEEKAKIEKKNALNQKARALSKGYIYHGIDEEDKNAKLFDNGAFEEGHAYYISSYIVYGNGNMGGAIVSLFYDPHYHYVDYISQKVKGEVIEEASNIFGRLPVSVVVVGGKAPMHTPIVIGLVK